MPTRRIIGNRVFLGYPWWRQYKPMWEDLVAQLHRKYPLHFLALGRHPGQPAEQLLAKILHGLDTSSQFLFDASTGNPNVSLEYGYARSIAGTRDVFLFWDEDSPDVGGKPLISDLAGSIANRYKMGDTRLLTAVRAIADGHRYTKLFRRVCRQRGYRGGTQRFALRVIRKLDNEDSILRRDLVDDLAHETGKASTAVDRFLKDLHRAGLISITRGNEWGSRVRIGG
jgi:hypothetical protein